jgi:hypothetical protein
MERGTPVRPLLHHAPQAWRAPLLVVMRIPKAFFVVDDFDDGSSFTKIIGNRVALAWRCWLLRGVFSPRPTQWGEGSGVRHGGQAHYSRFSANVETPSPQPLSP